MSKIAFISLGCPKNLVDSEQIITSLTNQGYTIVDDYHQANLVIINTCGFINSAVEESLENIAIALEQNGKVIVTGCLGARPEVIKEKYPQVLAITGPNAIKEILKIVQRHVPTSKINTETNIKLTPPHYAYLKISEGCNQNCSYCIIPQLRGKLVSRPLTEIMQEAEYLVDNGVKELIIVSQDTGAYGTDLGANAFKDLVQELSTLGIWVRLHYLYPYPHIDAVLPLMAEHKILPYLDIPLQHANSRILTMMQRPGDKTNMLNRIETWREICPDLTIRSTFIVGFPSETDDEFAELLDFLQTAQLDRVGCFKYSPVKGAQANDLPDQIAGKIKDHRWNQLMQVQQDISAARLQAKIGETIPVIIDEIQNEVAIGRSMGDAPDIDGQVIIHNNTLHPGEIALVTITGADEYDLYSE